MRNYESDLEEARGLALHALAEIAGSLTKAFPEAAVKAATAILAEARAQGLGLKKEELAKVMGITEQRARELLGDN